MTIVHTQAEFDQVAHVPHDFVRVVDGPIRIVGAASTVEVAGSAVLYESAEVSAVTGSMVEARGSSTVYAYAGSTVRAFERATVHVYERATVEAGPSVVVHRRDAGAATVTGGVEVTYPDLSEAAPRDWCAFYGVPVAGDGTAVLIKAVNQVLFSGYGTKYPIGETVTADDWDPVAECGDGLHFTATTLYSASYSEDGDGSRFLACRVVVDGMVALGNKVKVRSCEVLYEVDRYGRPLTVAEATS